MFYKTNHLHNITPNDNTGINYPNIGTPNYWIAPQPVIIPAPQTFKEIYGSMFNPVEAGANTTHVVFILDESGSMASVYDVTINSFNEFVKSQVEDSKKTGIKTFISLFKFDGYNIKESYNKILCMFFLFDTEVRVTSWTRCPRFKYKNIRFGVYIVINVGVEVIINF